MMNKEEMKNKIDALCADKDFCNKVSECKTIQEVAALFNDAGISMDAAELEKALAAVIGKKENDELDAEALENVSGGFISGAAFLTGALIYSAGQLAWAAWLATR